MKVFNKQLKEISLLKTFGEDADHKFSNMLWLLCGKVTYIRLYSLEM